MDSTNPFQPWAAKDGTKTDKDLVDDAKHHRENVNHPKHSQTTSYDKESAVVSWSAPGPSGGSGPEDDPTKENERNMDSARIASMQQIVENTLSPEARQRVSQLLDAVEALSGTERLLLYLRLPTGVPPHDPLKQPINPLGSRAELQQTVTWIQTHLEVDPDVSLPKQDVYDEYIAHCMSSDMKPLSTADFGKVMKQVYPTVRPRRLGTRGNSRYCYAGLRKKIKLEVPQLPDLGDVSKESTGASRETERIVCEWAESKLGIKFASLSELSRHLASAAAPAPATPPPLAALTPLVPIDDAAGHQLMKQQIKRKIQTHGTPGRPKKYKNVEAGAGGVGPATQPAAGAAGVGAGAGGSSPRASTSAGAGYEYAAYAPYSLAPRDYRRDAFALEPPPRDVPMNLSSDASLDLSTERRPRLPLPGKKLILETYQSERHPHQYLPKKMRAAEIHARQPPPPPPQEAPFLEDPKNGSSRSGRTAAALARDPAAATPGPLGPARPGCVAVCDRAHAELLSRERVISICSIDKHDLDDYLHEGSSQDNEEELLRYFQPREPPAPAPPAPAPAAPPPPPPQDFLETLDPQDEHSQGKNEKIYQLRELLAKNLKPYPSESPGEAAPAPAPDCPPLVTNGCSAKLANGARAPPPRAVNGHATRAQHYDFVPISDGCQSPRAYAKSPPGFRRSPAPPPPGARLASPPAAASPFVSPRDTPVPRSRLCARPVPKHSRRRRPELCKQFLVPDHKFSKAGCLPGGKFGQPMSAPPSPSLVCAQYRHVFAHNGHAHFAPAFRDGEPAQPLSADPLSSEVSQFFPECGAFREHDASFRSQSAPLKPPLAPLGYKTPVGSVPPTPVPNEFCDFGSLADTCDISRAGLNPETLDKIYDAIDSNSDALNPDAAQALLGATNGCALLPEPALGDELALIPDEELLARAPPYAHAYAAPPPPDDVEDFLKRSDSIEFDLPELVDKGKYCTSRSVPSTPLPGERPRLQLEPRRREPFGADFANGLSSKSVPSTPLLADDKQVFSYSNRDFLINGNSVDACGLAAGLASPLHDMLREDMLGPLTPHPDLLADLDKIETPYVDL